jgi:hypothetical protein
MNAVAEMDCTHNVPNEKHVPKDDREKAVSQQNPAIVYCP